MVNNVIGVVNYVIAARPSLRNFVIADSHGPFDQRLACILWQRVELDLRAAAKLNAVTQWLGRPPGQPAINLPAGMTSGACPSAAVASRPA